MLPEITKKKCSQIEPCVMTLSFSGNVIKVAFFIKIDVIESSKGATSWKWFATSISNNFEETFIPF